MAHTLAAAPWRRVLASIYDLFLQLAIIMVCAIVYAIFVNKITGQGVENLPRWIHQATLFPIMICCSFIYSHWCWSKSGRTLGMQAWHLQVADAYGEHKTLSIKDSLYRFIGSMFLPINLLLIFIHPKKQSLSDIFSNSQTIYYKNR